MTTLKLNSNASCFLQKRQKGSAILTALFIMTVVAIAATAISYRMHMDIKRTQLVKTVYDIDSQIEGDLLCTMSRWLKLNEHTFHHNENNRYLESSPLFTDLNKKVTDLQAKFNLNNLKDKKYIHFFAHLIQTVSPKTDNVIAYNIAINTYRWLQPYKAGLTLQSGNNSHYLKQAFPYLAAHKPFANISEWRLVKDVDESLFAKLAPYITVLPKKTSININTASKPILLAAGLKKETIQQILDKRKNHPYKKLSKFKKTIETLQSKPKIDISQFGVTSHYLLVSYEDKQYGIQYYEKIVAEKLRKNGWQIRRLTQTINSR